MSQHKMEANLKLFEPFDHPADYGVKDLVVGLNEAKALEGSAPVLSAQRVDALHADAESVDLSDLRDWFRSGDRYIVLDSGTEVARIPLLVAFAPDVADIEVSATHETSVAGGGEATFKIAGSGIGTSGKVTFTESLGINCGPGEARQVELLLPVYWERRARPDNEDINWVHTEISKEDRNPSVLLNDANGAATPPLTTIFVDLQRKGQKPFDFKRSRKIEVGQEFTAGFKIAALGIDTSLKVSVEASASTEVSSKMPTGHRYEVAWLGAPWGVRVTLRN